MSDDYYTVLGLPQNATAKQIRERFLELARERHPDRIRGDAKEQAELDFQAITEAFNTLSNAEQRREYDLHLVRPQGADAGDQTQAAQIAQAYIRRGVKAYKAKNYLEAAESFDRATQENSSDAQAWYYLALAASRRRAWLSRAADAIARACELAPMEVTYLKLAGKLFAQAGMASKAERYYSEALTWGGEDPAIQAAIEELNKGKKPKTGFFGKGE
jgi:curved DNA-binding protein CbpA